LDPERVILGLSVGHGRTIIGATEKTIHDTIP
jgi:hypothetical protein